MKKLFLLLILSISFSTELFACSYVPISFCATSHVAIFSDNLIVYGKITSIDDDGIDFEIFDVLRGEENRTTIRIWDGVDFECNGTWSMAASDLGEINDTLIILLPKISDKKSTWEVIGDYRRPDFFQYTPHLKVENGIIFGLISGHYTYPFVEEQAYYTNFKNSWNVNNDCSSVVLTNQTYESEQNFKILTLSNNKYIIKADNYTKNKLTIYNIFGLKMESEIFFIRELEIDLSSFSVGIYFFNLKTENNKLKILKVIKK